MIKVYGLAEQLNPVKARMSDVLHDCLTAVLQLPDDKRFQRFFPLPSEDFIFPADRSARFTQIEIHLMEGRSTETIKRLIHEIFWRFEQELALSPQDVEITVLVQPKTCWGFRGMTGDEVKLNYRLDL